jgi:hypothetical protein
MANRFIDYFDFINNFSLKKKRIFGATKREAIKAYFSIKKYKV